MTSPLTRVPNSAWALSPLSMRVVVTGGGTREPIDPVRYLANGSTGRLGVRISEVGLEGGHDVTLLRSASGALAPGGVTSFAFETSSDLEALLQEYAPLADVVVHAAAVADFIPEYSETKIPSVPEELFLRLVRSPKLVDRLRALCPEGFLVGFKLGAGNDEEALVSAAGDLLERASLDLVVANDVSATGVEDHEALLVGPSGVIGRASGKDGVAKAIASAWEGREAVAE